METRCRAIRVYEPDQSGSLRYAGAATVEDTPKEQKVQLTLAHAFDLFTESRLVTKQRVNRKTVRKQAEVVLHNEKPATIDLRVVQGFGGRWKVLRASHPHAKLNASHAQWRVRLPAGGQVTLPLVGAVAAQKYPVAQGTRVEGDTTLFVSRGVGTVLLPCRIGCPPEAALLTLRRA